MVPQPKGKNAVKRVQKELNKKGNDQEEPPSDSSPHTPYTQGRDPPDPHGDRRSPLRENPPAVDNVNCIADTSNDHIINHFSNKVAEPQENSSSTVVNLSNTTLSQTETCLLEKGLNFCPTPGEPHLGEIRRDLDRFHRNLRIKTFFEQGKMETGANSTSGNTQTQTTIGDNNTESSMMEKGLRESKLLKPSKGWEPPKGPLHLETFILSNEYDLNNTRVRAPRSKNLSDGERVALKNLRQKPDIVIKPADKGGAVVVQNIDDYIKEGERQLTDSTFYQHLPSDPTMVNNQRIDLLLESLHTRGEISKSVLRKLLTTEARTPELYLLPKIHKKQSPPPGRPVVSANGCPTEKISAFVDIFLRPHLNKIPSYIRDTTDFLQKLEALPELSEGSFLCTLDVSSLYTNIPNLEGLRAIGRFLSSHREYGKDPEPSNQSLCQLLNMVLTMNSFQFNGEDYLQVAGTAMGTRVAPTYANIFMADFERLNVYTYPLQPTMWVRFIDDIFMVWEHGETELRKFLEHLNKVHKTIKFTSEFSTENVSFLDTMVSRLPGGKVATDLYTKPTDSNNYLMFSSAHPSHCKRGIPLGQFLRLRRICSSKGSFIRNSIEKGKHFLRRGYPKDLVIEAFNKALNTERSTLLKQKDKRDKGTDSNILVTTYNPGYHGLKKVVQDNWDILGRSCTTRNIHRKKVLTSFRRPKSLKDLLVRAKLPKKKTHRVAPCNPCNTRSCRYCPKLNKEGRITCSASGRSYVSRYNVTCKSSNLVYGLTCKRCGIQYVGQTKNRLMDRFQGHFYNIGHNRPMSEIGRHFNTNGHKGLDDVEIHILDFIHAHPEGKKSKHLRDLIEYNWIQRLHTNAPTGLNIMDPMRP